VLVDMVLFYLLASLGLTYICKYGTILDVPRNWLGEHIPRTKELFKCSLCLGFWTGMFLTPVVLMDVGVCPSVVFPFASAAWCWTVDEIHDVIVSWKTKSNVTLLSE
jgi:hypothetical protein